MTIGEILLVFFVFSPIAFIGTLFVRAPGGACITRPVGFICWGVYVVVVLDVLTKIGTGSSMIFGF